jgi:endonuclease/exonuclease/phosphatase family metal-dependent hydrolase
MRVRIGTFNIENLVSRNRFGPTVRPDTGPALSLFDFPSPEDRQHIERSIAVALEDDKRQMTALAIAEGRADIWALQEVDNLGVLQAFFANYVHRLSDIRYGHFRLVHGNDRRGIDVACVLRHDIAADTAIRTRSNGEATFEALDVYEDELISFGITPQNRVFTRDCLEVDLGWGDRSLTMFITHLKSMSGWSDDGRPATTPIRRAEARAIRHLVERRFGPAWRDASWMIIGDLNDYRERILAGADVERSESSSLDVLLDGFAVNPLDALPPDRRWTHFHRAWSEPQARLIEEHVQLDYLLLSPALASANPAPPIEIIRRGLPYRVPLDPAERDRSIAFLSTRGDRYPRIGWDRPKASDHCPVIIELTIPAGPPASRTSREKGF